MGSIRRNPLLVLAAAVAVAVLATGTRNTFGLYLRPMTEVFGWGRGTFAFAIALQAILWGLLQPVTGMLADRFGSGKVILGGGLIYALGLYTMSRVSTPLGFTVAAGILVAVGLSGTGFPVTFGAVVRVAPVHRRSLFLGIATAGGSIGQFVMLPVGQALISGLGWSNALVAAGGFMLAMPVLALALSGRAVGPDRDSREAAGPVQALKRAGSERRYWLLFWGFFVCGFHVAFIATHLPAFLTDNAFSPRIGALALSLVGLFNIAGTLTFGYLGGRFSKRVTLSALYLCRAVVIGLFVTLPLSMVSIVAFAGSMGFLWLGTVPLTSGLAGQMYGMRYLSTLFSVIFLGHQVGSFLGAWVGGRVFDLTGSYQPLWYASIALGVFSALLHWPIDERSPEEIAGLAQVRPAGAGG